MPNLNVCGRLAVTPAPTGGVPPLPALAARATVVPTPEAIEHSDEHRIERLIDRVPNALRPAARWLRRPSSRWLRIPAGVLLVGGGVLSILPLLGIWMLPLGLMLLAEDLPPLRRARGRVLGWISRHRPHWLAEARS
jgi:hypothetical protein